MRSGRGSKVHLAGAVAVLLLAAAACSSESATPQGDAGTGTTGREAVSARGADVARPTITGPVTGGEPGTLVNATLPEYLEEYGYVEEEYFMEGTATAYLNDGTWSSDGRWTVGEAGEAPYRTRIIVRRPSDPAAFSGNVIVEWLNVSSGRDADPDFGFAYEQFLGNGDAYVAVSAQAIGVEGGGTRLPIEGYNPVGLKEWDPDRYGSLDHPGDEYSYDMFSQTAQAVLRPDGVDPMDGLRAEHLIAAGESQSAGRMVTYVNAIQPVAAIYDGFFIHSRGGSGALLNAAAPDAVPSPGMIRTDLDVPVMQFQTETDMFQLGFHPARQPDTDLIRTWETAGTAHADQSTLDYGIETGRTWDTSSAVPDFNATCGAINTGPQAPLVRAAFAALEAWVVDGTPPATAPALEIDAGAIVRDEHGNAQGGIRTPAVDAPTATLTGQGAAGGIICAIFGTTEPFDAATLAALYPTHDAYVAAVTESATAAVDDRFLLQADADAMIAAAETAAVPS